MRFSRLSEDGGISPLADGATRDSTRRSDGVWSAWSSSASTDASGRRIPRSLFGTFPSCACSNLARRHDRIAAKDTSWAVVLSSPETTHSYSRTLSSRSRRAVAAYQVSARSATALPFEFPLSRMHRAYGLLPRLFHPRRLAQRTPSVDNANTCDRSTIRRMDVNFVCWPTRARRARRISRAR